MKLFLRIPNVRSNHVIDHNSLWPIFFPHHHHYYISAVHDHMNQKKKETDNFLLNTQKREEKNLYSASFLRRKSINREQKNIFYCKFLVMPFIFYIAMSYLLNCLLCNFMLSIAFFCVILYVRNLMDGEQDVRFEKEDEMNYSEIEWTFIAHYKKKLNP